jgi:hypothetical protein
MGADARGDAGPTDRGEVPRRPAPGPHGHPRGLRQGRGAGRAGGEMPLQGLPLGVGQLAVEIVAQPVGPGMRGVSHGVQRSRWRRSAIRARCSWDFELPTARPSMSASPRDGSPPHRAARRFPGLPTGAAQPQPRNRAPHPQHAAHQGVNPFDVSPVQPLEGMRVTAGGECDLHRVRFVPVEDSVTLQQRRSDGAGSHAGDEILAWGRRLYPSRMVLP